MKNFFEKVHDFGVVMIGNLIDDKTREPSTPTWDLINHEVSEPSLKNEDLIENKKRLVSNIITIIPIITIITGIFNSSSEHQHYNTYIFIKIFIQMTLQLMFIIFCRDIESNFNQFVFWMDSTVFIVLNHHLLQLHQVESSVSLSLISFVHLAYAGQSGATVGGPLIAMMKIDFSVSPFWLWFGKRSSVASLSWRHPTSWQGHFLKFQEVNEMARTFGSIFDQEWPHI